MIGRQIRRGFLVSTILGLWLALSPTLGIAGFPQSTETSGEITPDLDGAWLVVNRLEFPRPSPEPSPGAPTPAPGAASIRPFTVAYIFKIDHLATADAEKVREADRAKKQEAVDKATKILAEEQRKAAANPKPVASSETPVEPKVLTYGTPRNADSVVDLQDEISVNLLDVEIPKSIQDQIDEANKAEKPWEPSDKDLATFKSSWKTLKVRAKSEYSRIQWKVMQDKYLEGGMQQDEKTRDAKFVISGDATLIAGPGQANRNIIIYGAKQVSDTVIEGGHVRAIMTGAPFPIPIDMKGSFKMYRLTDLKKAAAKKAK